MWPPREISGGSGLYPATSPDVLAVGGTSLTLNASGNYLSETAWGDSNGGFSQDEVKPSYQDSVLPSSEANRSVPDVAFDANPATGVAIYDSYDNTAATPWSEEGGTSLGSPAWAGLVAIADQGRAAAGETAFNTASATQLLSAIYSLPQEDFRDVTSGSNQSYSAAVGFDQVTGMGHPQCQFAGPRPDCLRRNAGAKSGEPGRRHGRHTLQPSYHRDRRPGHQGHEL